jgi:flap endonuclease-1
MAVSSGSVRWMRSRSLFFPCAYRWGSSGGQSLAIDGTLLTYRFHFVDDENVNRTLVAWYRLLRTLHEEYNILPICVFDGSGRRPEKARERERRVQSRRLLVARGMFEKSRGVRLRELAAAFQAIQALPPNEASQIIQAAREYDQLDATLATKPIAAPSATGS